MELGRARENGLTVARTTEGGAAMMVEEETIVILRDWRFESSDEDIQIVDFPGAGSQMCTCISFNPGFDFGAGLHGKCKWELM